VRIDTSEARTTDDRYALAKRTIMNIDMQFSHLDPGRASAQNISTMVIRKHQPGAKPAVVPSSQASSSSSNVAQSQNKGNSNLHQGNQKRQRTMVIQGGGPRNGKKTRSDAPTSSVTTVCTHCYQKHEWTPDRCYMNKEVPRNQIPQPFQHRVLMQRRYRYGPEYDWPNAERPNAK